MKKEIENREDLLRSLALKGDSHAFFSISAPYFRARYLRERSTGASHPDAQTRVLAEAIELLEKLQHVAPSRIDAWFEEHCMIIASNDDDLQETIADKNLLAEAASFLNRCSKELVSNGSKMKQKRLLRARRFPQVLFDNRIVMGLLIVGLAAAFCLAAILLMTWFKASVQFSFETPDRQFSFRIPMASYTDNTADADAESTNVDASELKKVPKYSPQPKPAPVQSAMSTVTPPPRPAPLAPAPQASQSSAAPRALPPVIPKARMVLPPMPPQSIDPAVVPTPPSSGDAAPSPTVLPSSSPPSFQTEDESTN